MDTTVRTTTAQNVVTAFNQRLAKYIEGGYGFREAANNALRDSLKIVDGFDDAEIDAAIKPFTPSDYVTIARDINSIRRFNVVIKNELGGMFHETDLSLNEAMRTAQSVAIEHEIPYLSNWRLEVKA